MPKIAGVPSRRVPVWSKPSISLRAAWTLSPSYHYTAGMVPVKSVPATTAGAGADSTGTTPAVEWYDGLKVQATLNEIDGFDHTGTRRLGTPAIFGMNFQSVSVGQKLACCGYADTSGTPSAGLADA